MNLRAMIIFILCLRQLFILFRLQFFGNLPLSPGTKFLTFCFCDKKAGYALLLQKVCIVITVTHRKTIQLQNFCMVSNNISILALVSGSTIIKVACIALLLFMCEYHLSWQVVTLFSLDQCLGAGFGWTICRRSFSIYCLSFIIRSGYLPCSIHSWNDSGDHPVFESFMN